MSTSHWVAFVAVDLVVAGLCVSWWLSQGDPAPQPSASPQTAVAAAPHEQAIQKLAESYAKHHRAGNHDALLDLFCWEGVDDLVKEAVAGSVRDDLEQPLVDVQFKPLGEQETLEYEQNGVRYRPNLPIVGKLQVGYKLQDETRIGTTTYLIGRDGEQLLLATAIVD